MTGIPIYAKGEEDFSTNGLGLLTPLEATVEEDAAGKYEATIVQPIDGTYRWAQIQGGCILKIPTPVRESPIYEAVADGNSAETEVTREIWKVVKTSVGVRLRTGPGTGYKRLSTHKNGTRVVNMGETENGFMHVVMVDGGAEGWMSTKYLEKESTQTETITPEKPGNSILNLEQSRDQLFRIYSVETDTDEQTVTAKAMHIFYDQRGNLIDAEYEPENVPVATAVAEIKSKLLDPNPITWHIQRLTGNVSGTYSFKTPVEAFLDPDEGIVAQTKALLVRDNFNAYLLPDAVRDRGVTVRRRKNLVGVTVSHDEADIATRVIPVGKDKDGNPLYLSGSNYPKKYVERIDVDASFVPNYATTMTARIEYDVSVGTPDEENKDKVFKTDAEAMAELYRRACLEFTENGIDLPKYGMEVDFVLLGNTEEYANYASLNAVHLYDTVTVIDELIGVTAKLRVTGYEWDALRKQYKSVTLGNLQELKQTVYSFNIPNGSVSGIKLIPNSADGSILRNATIQYAKIAVAAIEQLSANAITALIARINEVIAGKITTDELYAGIAEIVALKVSTLEAKDIETDTLAAELARLQVLIAGTASFGRATVQHLVAKALNLTFGVGDTVFIKNLAVDFAQMVSAQIGSLCIKASDGNYYTIDVNPDGTVSATPATVTEGEISAGQTDSGRVILETSIVASKLNTSNLLATYALVNEIDAARIDVDQLFAREAFIAKLATSLIVGGKSLTMIAGEAESGNTRIDKLLENRNFLMHTAIPYTAYGLGVDTNLNRHLPYLCPSLGLAKSLYGQTVTVSFDYVANITAGSAKVATVNTWQNLREYDSSATSGHTTRTIKLNVPATIDNRIIYITGKFEGTFTISNLKVELGSTATAWAPAPEDSLGNGKNLARNTADSVTTVSTSATGSTRTFTVADPYWRGYKIRLDESENYTLSFDYEFDWSGCAAGMPAGGFAGLAINLFCGDGVKGSGEEFKTNITSQQADYSAYGEGYSRGRFVLTFSGLTDSTYPYFAFRALRSYGPDITGARITISNFMLEKGNSASKWEPSSEDVQEQLGSVQADADFATPHDSEEPPATAPAAGKLWIDRGTTPPIFRRWKGQDVSTDRDWSQEFALSAGDSPNAFYDNSTGMLETIDSVTTAFTPGQEGSGNPSPGNYRALAGYAYLTLWQNSYGQTSSVIQKSRIEFGETIYGAEVDWLNGIWKQTHMEYALTGEETISLQTPWGTNRFAVYVNALTRPAADYAPVCSHLLGSSAPYSGNAVDNAICIDRNFTDYILMYIRCDAYATVDALKAWLRAQYAAGTPVRVVYKLKEPIAHRFAPAVVDVFESMLFLHVSPDAVVAPRTLAVNGTFSGWETLNSAEDIRAAQAQIQLNQQNAQAAIDELRTAVVTDNEGVHVRKVDNDNVQLIQNEVLITQKDVNIVSGGVRNSSFGSGYVRLLDMVIRATSGGIVIEAAEV